MIKAFLQNSPINRKLIRINMLVTGAALLVASSAFLFFELAAFRETMVRNLSVQAQIAGASGASALLSGDSGSASRTLAALKASPYVLFAGLYTRDGKLFASYSGSKDSTAPPLPRLAPQRAETHRFTSGDLSLVHEIDFQGKLVGSIYVRTGLREFNDRVLRCFGVFGVVLFLSLFAAFALSAPVQRALARPIVELAEVARMVSRLKNYSLRAPTTASHDEIAVLIDAFNEMLSGIQARDAALENAHERLNLALKSAGHQLIGLEERDITGREHLEAQPRQAQSLDSISQIASGVAHDFNNLLTVIIGYCEVMFSALPPDDRMREFIDEIHQAAQRAGGLTRHLQVFSRRQGGEPKIVRVNDLIAGIEKMLRRLIGRQIDMRVILDDNAGCLRADPGHIEQVIMNLVMNARDAMPAGGKLTIETSHLFVDEDFARMHLGTMPGDNIMLSVTDTGMGISRENKARIFEPFFTTREGQSTGLGLSTVYGIVKQSGGSIWVDSEPGMGAIFKVLFPGFADPAEAPDAGHASAAEEPLSGNETILVAEDEPGVRRYVRQILVRNGYTVLEASEGNEAMEIVGANHVPIHLLLTDVVMPDTGGVELAEYFSRMHPGVPFIYMSGYSEHLWFREDVPVNLLQKPFTAAALLKRIRDLLDRPPKLAMTQGAA